MPNVPALDPATLAARARHYLLNPLSGAQHDASARAAINVGHGVGGYGIAPQGEPGALNTGMQQHYPGARK